MSWAIISRVTAAVDRRSSQNATGRSRNANTAGARGRADAESADICPVRQREQCRDVIAKAAAADRLERAGDHQPRVRQRKPDRLGPDVESHDAPPWRHRRSQFLWMIEEHC